MASDPADLIREADAALAQEAANEGGPIVDDPATLVRRLWDALEASEAAVAEAWEQANRMDEASATVIRMMARDWQKTEEERDEALAALAEANATIEKLRTDPRDDYHSMAELYAYDGHTPTEAAVRIRRAIEGTSINTPTAPAFPSLAAELDLVRANFEQRDWIAVCAHGAVQTCKGLRPGDEHIIRAVMRHFGLSEPWNDDQHDKAVVAELFASVEVTDEALEATFGPQWRKIVWLTRRAAVLTADEAGRMCAAWDAARAARVAARDAARDAAWDAARSAAWDAARSAARSAARDAAWDAALSCVVEDLIGQHGLTQDHIDALRAPWVSVLGSIEEAGDVE